MLALSTGKAGKYCTACAIGFISRWKCLSKRGRLQLLNRRFETNWGAWASGLDTENPISQTRQVAALPIRRTPTGGIEVLLITSRDTQRWIVPKGWPWTDKTDPESAAGEAEEEAGVTGDIETSSFGRYAYEKQLKADSVTLSVDVFLLWVQEVREDWLEKPERRRLWFPPDEAAYAVQEPQLKAVLRALNKLPQRR